MFSLTYTLKFIQARESNQVGLTFGLDSKSILGENLLDCEIFS